MSRTPERIIDKKAVEERNSCFGWSFFLGFVSFVLLGEGAAFWGFIVGCFAFGLFWHACKMKTVFYKTGEISGYVKR